MLPRQICDDELAQAREALSSKGITQREAADLLGVTLWHLNRVLRGHRVSKRILRGINALSPKKGGRK